MRVFCTRCGEPRDAHPGERVRCARCGALFEVPAAPARPVLSAAGLLGSGLAVAVPTLHDLAVVAALLTVPAALLGYGLDRAGVGHFKPVVLLFSLELWEACALNALWAARDAGRSLPASDALLAGAAQLPRALGASLVCLVRVALYLLLLIVPGVQQAVALSLAVPAAVLERRGPWAAAQRSLALSEGQRGALFWALLVAGALSRVPRAALWLGLRAARPQLAALGGAGALLGVGLAELVDLVGIAVVMAVVYAAYRKLTGAATPSPAPPPDAPR